MRSQPISKARSPLCKISADAQWAALGERGAFLFLCKNRLVPVLRGREVSPSPSARRRGRQQRQRQQPQFGWRTSKRRWGRPAAPAAAKQAAAFLGIPTQPRPPTAGALGPTRERLRARRTSPRLHSLVSTSAPLWWFRRSASHCVGLLPLAFRRRADLPKLDISRARAEGGNRAAYPPFPHVRVQRGKSIQELQKALFLSFAVKGISLSNHKGRERHRKDRARKTGFLHQGFSRPKAGAPHEGKWSRQGRER